MQTITLTIEENTQTLNPSDLADFLYLFRATNLALNQFVPSKIKTSLRPPTEKERQEYLERISTLLPGKLDALFDQEAPSDVLQIFQMERQSPLQMVIGGCGFLLTLAVIFSGGKISFTLQGVKASLPSFGTGLKHLRQALGLDKTLRAGYGIRGTIIKLNKQECDALLQELSGQGGFQNLLHRLQNRVNKQTRELELSPDDLERIYRYKTDPKKGGFQSRFKRIFGRHFPDNSNEPNLGI